MGCPHVGKGWQLLENAGKILGFFRKAINKVLQLFENKEFIKTLHCCRKIDQGTAERVISWRCDHLHTELSTEFVDTCGKALIRLILSPANKGEIGLRPGQASDKPTQQSIQWKTSALGGSDQHRMIFMPVAAKFLHSNITV